MLELLKKLKELVPDIFPRDNLLSEFERGKIAGKLELIDYIESLLEKEGN